jgi:hypothetical protein
LLDYADNKGPKGHLPGQMHGTKGKQFSFFKSYYLDDTAFLYFSRSDLDKAAKPIVFSLPTFRVDYTLELAGRGLRLCVRLL